MLIFYEPVCITNQLLHVLALPQCWRWITVKSTVLCCPRIQRDLHWWLFMTQVLLFLQCSIFSLALLAAPGVACTRSLGFYLTHSHPSTAPKPSLLPWSQGSLESVSAILVLKVEFTTVVTLRDNQLSILSSIL